MKKKNLFIILALAIGLLSIGEYFKEPSSMFDGIDLWSKNENSFFYKYIQSMLAEDKVNNQTITIRLY